MSSINSVHFSGNLGADAEFRTTPSGTSLLNFSLAVSEGKDKPTMWVRHTVFGKYAEALNGHLLKGAKVVSKGRLSIRKGNNDVYYTSVIVDSLDFMSKGNGNGGQQQPPQQGAPQQQQQQQQSPQQQQPPEWDDDIPF